MARNILLTTLGTTFDHTRHYYFEYETEGERKYCEGISTAEAGAKYILSQVPIDSIIVLGPLSAYKEERAKQELGLKDCICFGAMEPENYSEYQFFCYRIMQFLNRIDIEGNDLLLSMPEEEKKALLSKVQKYYDAQKLKTKQKRDFDQCFSLLDTTEDGFADLEDALGGLNKASRKWLKHYLYMVMAKEDKLFTISDNADITVQFVPTVIRGKNMQRLDNLPDILEIIRGKKNQEVNLYVDLQGMDLADSHTMINVLFMLQNEKGNKVNIKEIITTTYRPALFTNPIENQKNRLELSQLLSGMDAFLQYGKVDSIRRYWESRNIKDEHIERLIYAMQTVDIGISLCSESEMLRGIKMLKMVFADPVKPSSAIESMIFTILETGIRYDYGKLLAGDDINILALIKWAMQKHFYMQALTIIESRIPYDLVHLGVFYYARNEADKARFLEQISYAYWGSPHKDRYQFDHTAHYFVKFYRRREVYQMKSSNPAAAYINMRINEVYDEASEYKSFTRYRGPREKLQELMTVYMGIGSIRNQISHAQEVEVSTDHWDWTAENEKIRLLKTNIEKFVELYGEIKSGLDPKIPLPLVLDDEEIKNYCRTHQVRVNNNEKKK